MLLFMDRTKLLLLGIGSRKDNMSYSLIGTLHDIIISGHLSSEWLTGAHVIDNVDAKDVYYK